MRNYYTFLYTVVFFAFFPAGEAEAQNCDSLVPAFIVNLTGNPDSSWTSPAVQRDGQCCGVAPPDICVSFMITLDPNSVSIVFNITSGAIPPGALFYQVNCGPQVAVGDTICLNGVGPHEITFCKPGNNINEYTITAIEAPNAPDSITVRQGCSAEMVAFGYYESTITWNSIFPGPPGTYNSYLNCISGCDTVTVTPQPGYPPFIDYVVSGMAQAPCTTVTGSDTIRVYIVADLLAQINPQNPTICFGGSDTLLTVVPSGGLPPYTYIWSNGDTTSSTLVGPGTYWVQVSDATDCPPVYDTVTVNVFTLPITANAGTDLLTCSTGPPVQLNGSVVSASGGQWLGGGGGYNPGSTTLNAIYTPSPGEVSAGNANLILITTGNQGCPPDTDTVQIIITPLPVAQAGPDILVCSSAPSVSLNGQVTGGSVTGQWSSSGTGSFSPGNTTLNASYLLSPADISNGSVMLILTSTGNGGCPPDADTLIITIDEAPSSLADPDQTICSNSSAALNGQIPAGSGTGQWTSSGSGGFSPNNTTLNATYTPSPGDIVAGSVLLILTSTNNGVCPAAADTMILTISPLAVVSAGPSVTVCANNAQAVLSGTISGVTSTGQWSTNGSGTFAPNNTTLNASYTPSPADIASGNVILTLTSTSNGVCPPVTDTMLVVITPAPVVAAGPDQNVCSSSPVQLNGNVSGGSSTGQWTSSGTVTITLQATNIGNCSPVNDVVVITIFNEPVANAGPDQSICSNVTNVQLAGQVGGSSGTGIWISNGTGTFSPANTTLNANYTPGVADISAGSVMLILSSTNNGPCGTDNDTMIITITQVPVANAGNNITVCANNSNVPLNGIISGGSGTGQWTTNGTGAFIPASTSLSCIYQPSAGDIAAGGVILTLTSTNNGNCPASTDNLQVIITPAPVVLAGADQSICAGSAFQLTGFVGGGSGTGTWTSTGSGTFSPNNTALNGVYTPGASDLSAGVVMLILTSTNNGNCFAVSDTLVLLIVQPAVVNAGNDQALCADDLPFTLNATITGGSGTGQWTTNGSGIFIPSPASPSAIYVPGAADIAAGSVIVFYTSTNNGPCPAATDLVQLIIHPVPVAAFTVNQTTVFLPNAPIVITNQSNGASAYEWDFGDGSTTSLVNPQYEYQEVGTYTITLIATNSFGCDDTATQEIIATSDIVFPNAFTPNPDGPTGGAYSTGSLDNNIFFPYTAGVDRYHLQIFNRWGELIFESFDLMTGWDGYYRGELCQQDTYVWKANVRFYDGRRYLKVGDVTLLR
ncbi:MAG: CHU large protein [Bacteroidetes bacterium]|nr:MAG: CHU large protein [Bacteroidota bacterium]